MTDPKVKRISDQRLSDILLMVVCKPISFVTILFWRLIGKRLRARSLLMTAIAGLPFANKRWMQDAGKHDCEEATAARREGAAVPVAVHLHIARAAKADAIKRAINALRRQSIAPAPILISRDDEAVLPSMEQDVIFDDLIFDDLGEFATRIDALGSALEKARKAGVRWLVPLDTSSELTKHAIAAFEAHLINRAEQIEANVLFGDEIERAHVLGSRNFWFKPDWDPRMILSQDYVSRACAIAVAPALELIGSSDEADPKSLYELILLVSQSGGGARASVQHLNRIVAVTEHLSWQNDAQVRADAVRRVLADRIESVSEGPYGTLNVQYSSPEEPPMVSVLVATRDRVELLRTCVEGVLNQTDYANLEVIIADNESVEPETLAYMETLSSDPRVTVVRWPHPFNYSAINNFAARHATGDFLCLLNNDIEVLDPHWLSAMVKEAVQPGIGAVGARLLYPDRSIQHAGVAIGIGNAAGHAHRGLEEDEIGYFAQALITRGASAVTAACLVVARKHFEAVGGLDEEGLAVAYNDVDLCLKLQAMGLTNIYTPEATLIHHESKSRGLDFAPEHLERYMRELKVFQDRWDTRSVVDPWHHPRLARGSEVFKTH